MKNYLDVFLKEAQSLQRNLWHIKEVCFLCIQCIEVSISDCNFRLGNIQNDRHRYDKKAFLNSFNGKFYPVSSLLLE